MLLCVHQICVLLRIALTHVSVGRLSHSAFLLQLRRSFFFLGYAVSIVRALYI